jgi:hypothetical protein
LHINLFSLEGQLTFGHAKAMAIASALACFISLIFVMIAVYALRIFVTRPAKPKVRPLSTRPQVQAI